MPVSAGVGHLRISHTYQCPCKQLVPGIPVSWTSTEIPGWIRTCSIMSYKDTTCGRCAMTAEELRRRRACRCPRRRLEEHTRLPGQAQRRQ